VSYFFGFAALGVVLGLFCSQYIALPFWTLLLAVMLAGVSLWKKRAVLVGAVILAGLLLGWYRGSVYRFGLIETESYVNRTIIVSGIIIEDATVDTSRRSTVVLGRLRINDKEQIGYIQATVSPGRFTRGDTVTLRGVPTSGFGSATLTIRQATVVSVKLGHDPIVAFRDWFVTAVRSAIKEPEASLGVGYLVGQKSALPPDLVSSLQIAGLTHVVVASGYNLTILVRLSRRLLARVSKFTALSGSVALVVCMMGITGLSPSMTRAGLVTGLSLATWYYGRSIHPMILLSLAAAVTGLLRPSYVWNDLGWALSFTAFAGVMIVAPLMHRYLFGEKEPGTFRQILGETVAAHMTTAPLIVLVFSQISNVAVFTNMLILPLVPLAMLLTFIAGVVAVILPAFSTVAGLPAQWLLTYMVETTQYFAGLPWAQTIVHVSSVTIGVIYCLIVGLILYMWRVTRLNFRQTSVVT